MGPNIHYALHGAEGVLFFHKMLCKFRFVIIVLIIPEMFTKSNLEWSIRLSNVFLVTGWASYLGNTAFIVLISIVGVLP